MIFQVQNMAGIQVVEMRGEIINEDPKAFAKLMEINLRKNVSTIFKVHSAGGSLPAALAMALSMTNFNNELNLSQKEIITYVDEGAHCVSACLVLFNIGNNRFAARTAQFGFHSGTHNGVQNAQLREIYLDTFYKDGIDPQWIQKNMWMFLTTEITLKTAIQLLNEKSGFFRAQSYIQSFPNLIELINKK